MKKENVEILKLTAREILLSLCDLGALTLYTRIPFYRKPYYEYFENREKDRNQIMQKIYYLKRYGYVRTFVKDREKYLAITMKGRKKIYEISLDKIKIKRPKHWDGKWRVVIFDIPEESKAERDFFRQKLKILNFIRVQKSVYTFPFDCSDEVQLLSGRLKIDKYVTIIIAEIIQGERKIIEDFIDWGLINRSDIKIKK